MSTDNVEMGLRNFTAGVSAHHHQFNIASGLFSYHTDNSYTYLFVDRQHITESNNKAVHHQYIANIYNV